MNVARHVLLSVVFLLVLIAPTSRAHAAEKLTVGAACTGDQNAADWDAIFQCVGSVWKRAPIWLGASADACDATHKGLIQWTGTGFQACSNGTSWESLGGSSSFLGANATNTAPSRSGDLGTGLFSDTASTVSVATAGVERLRLSATGATLTGDLNLSAVTNILSIAGTAILRHPVGNGTSLGIGRGSLQTQTGTVSYNYALGFQALRTNTASGTDAGSYNNAIGRRVLYSNTATGSNTGSYNNAIGNGALDTNIANGGEAGSYNNAIGSYTLNYNDAKGPSAGSLNNAIGLYALYNSIASGTFAGSNNNAFGMESLKNNDAIGDYTGSYNNAVGSSALFRNKGTGAYAGSYNNAIGYFALYNNTGSGNTAIGSYALGNTTATITGSRNVALGWGVGQTGLTSGSDNILIGTSSAVTTPTTSTSNWLNIGNLIYGDMAGVRVGIGSATINAGASLDLSSRTDSLLLPTGTEGQRPVTPAVGMLRYNTTSNALESYQGSTATWTSLGGGGALVLGTTATNTAPSRSGDLGTGLFSDTATTVSVATGGVQRLIVTATGSVGIGTATPSHALTVNGDIALSAITNALYLADAKVLHHPASDTTSFGVGPNALIGQTATNANNSAFGYNALQYADVGKDNSAFGSYALYYNWMGVENSAFGVSALVGNEEGSYNAAFGKAALAWNSTGSYNSAFGSYALNQGSAGSQNSAVGYYALYRTTGNNNTALGYMAGSQSAVVGISSGSNNTVIGYMVGSSTLTTGSNNILIGTSSAVTTPAAATNNWLNIGNAIKLDMTAVTATNPIISMPALDNTSIGVGLSALQRQTVTNTYNTAVGYRALYMNTTGAANVALGYGALSSTTTGSGNTAAGWSALPSNTAGYNNSAYGRGALYSNTTAYYNSAFGRDALFGTTTGISNTAIGYQSMFSNVEGSNNTALGVYSLYRVGGSNNTALGYQAGGTTSTGLTTGVNNTILGYSVGSTTLSTGSSNILIGTSSAVDTPAAGTSNWLNIGNTIYGELSGKAVSIGSATITAGAGLDLSSRTGTAYSSMIVPKDTTTNRPTTPVVGMLRYNTTLNSLESYQGSTATWVALGAGGGSGTAAANGQSFITGYPDVIKCSIVASGITYDALFHLASRRGTDGEGYYRLIGAVATNNDFSLQYTNGSYTSGGLGSWTSNDCMTNAWSIAQLVANGRAFNIVNGSVAATASITDGTSGAPGLYFDADQDTGIYRPTDNTIGFSTAGTEALRVTATNSVGIGTAAPSHTLTVSGDIALSAITNALYLAGTKILHQPASDTRSIGVGPNALIGQTATNLYNTAVGPSSLFSNSTGGSNTAMGSTALFYNITGSYNSAFGRSALYSNSTGYSNSAFGYQAMQFNERGFQNSAFGQGALRDNERGSDNVALGMLVMVSGTTGFYRTAVGNSALYRSSGNYNTALGYMAGGTATSGITTGTNNLVLGPMVGSTTIATGSNNILIGTSSAVDTPAAATNNWLNIGNLIYGEMSGKAVSIGSATITAGVGLDLSSRTGTAYSSMIVPKDTTTNRPTTPVVGMLRYNTTLNSLESYQGSTATWTSLGGGGALVLGTTATNTAPSRSGDLGTGLFSDTATTVSVATAGVERLRLSATGATLTGDLNLSSITNALYIAGTKILHQPASDTTSIALGSAVLGAQTGVNRNNTAVGVQSLRYNITGGNNTSVGYMSMYNNTSGNDNSAFGIYSLYNNQSGNNNAAFGPYALYFNSTGTQNSAFGPYALQTNANGSENSAFGMYALYGNTSGGQNAAFGAYALYTNTTGIYNSAFGGYALYYNSTGMNNTAVGSNSLFLNTSGSQNTAVGREALRANTSGANNTAVGYYALYSNSTGTYNTAVGVESLRGNTSGLNNTAVGYNALYNNSTGHRNTAIGHTALLSNLSGNYNTALGQAALQLNSAGVNNTAIGDSALAANSTGDYNTAVGSAVLYSNTSGQKNTALGYQVGFSYPTTGSSNILIGTSSAVRTPAAATSNFLNIGNTVFGDLSSGRVLLQGGATVSANTPTAGTVLDMGYATGTAYSSMIVPKDTTTNRPTTPVVGMLRYNTTLNALESYQGSTATWTSLGGGGALVLGDSATNTAPSRSGDLGTGLFSNTATTVSVATGGVQRLIVTATGSVGIGTATPWQELSVNGDIALSALTNALYIAGTRVLFHPANDPTSFAAGPLALVSQTTSNIQNSAFGYQALLQNSTGSQNSAFGALSMYSNTRGSVNSAFGGSALYNNTSGSYNSAFGAGALYSNATGNYNSAFGFQAMRNNLAGSTNSAFGYYALYNNTTANNNTAFGSYSLNGNTTGEENVAVGGDALRSNSTGSYNVALGFSALYTNTSGQYNTGLGYFSLYLNSTGSNNTAVGSAALYLNTSGSQNTAVGREALRANTSGANNSAVGYRALYTNSTGTSNTAVGTSALYYNTYGNFNTAVGVEALQTNNTGTENTAVGYQALNSNSTGGYNSALGNQALRSNTSGNNNSAFGGAALYANTIGADNTAVGNQALNTNTSGASNTALGADALRLNSTGNYNTAVGRQALLNNTSGVENTAIGAQALTTNNVGIYNTAVGTSALRFNTSGAENIAVGYQAMQANSLGTQNTALGTYALYANSTGGRNTSVGYYALFSNTTGTNNTVLGYQVGYTTLTTGSSNILIGTSSAVTTPAAATSNFLNIGNTVFGDLSSGRVLLQGGATVSANTPTAGTVLDMGYATGTAYSSMIVPKDTTTNRPTTPVVGMLRYNTTTSSLESYQGSTATWTSLGGGGALVLGDSATNTAPSRSGDLGTGLFSNTATTVSIATGGVQRLIVTATGSVGIGTATPAQELSVVGDATFSGNLAVADGTYSSARGITLNLTATDASYTGVHTTLNLAGALTATRTNYGSYTSVISGADNTSFPNNIYGSYSLVNNSNGTGYTNAYGAYNRVLNNDTSLTNATSVGTMGHITNAASGILTAAYGLWGVTVNDAGGTISNARGVNVQVRNDEGTITNGYGVLSNMQQAVAGGTMSNSYAFYAQQQQVAGTMGTGYLYYGSYSGTYTKKWGLYLTGETDNYLSGNLGIGTATPTAKLDVNGTANFSGLVSASTTPTAPEHLANKAYVDSKAGAGTDGLVGMIAAFHKTPLPTNWVECNGQTVSSATYPELVLYLSGSATAVSATMPDYRGYFLRGVNTAATGIDPNRVLGSTQADDLASHGHTASSANSTATAVATDTEAATGITTSSAGAHTHTVKGAIGTADGIHTTDDNSNPGGGTHGTATTTSNGDHTHTATVPAHAHSVTVPAHNHTITVNATGGTETRPENIAVIYAMRAK